jgi:hypothetical protein
MPSCFGHTERGRWPVRQMSPFGVAQRGMHGRPPDIGRTAASPGNHAADVGFIRPSRLRPKPGSQEMSQTSGRNGSKTDCAARPTPFAHSPEGQVYVNFSLTDVFAASRWIPSVYIFCGSAIGRLCAPDARRIDFAEEEPSPDTRDTRILLTNFTYLAKLHRNECLVVVEDRPVASKPNRH